MLHSKHITLTAGKTEATATKTRFNVNKGVISRVWISFPPGCAGLVNLRLYHQGHPFLPVDKLAYITGDAYTFEIPVMFEILTQPENITIEAWNTDDTFEHTIHVLMLIVDKKWVQPVGAYEGIIAALKSLHAGGK